MPPAIVVNAVVLDGHKPSSSLFSARKYRSNLTVGGKSRADYSAASPVRAGVLLTCSGVVTAFACAGPRREATRKRSHHTGAVRQIRGILRHHVDACARAAFALALIFLQFNQRGQWPRRRWPGTDQPLPPAGAVKLQREQRQRRAVPDKNVPLRRV